MNRIERRRKALLIAGLQIMALFALVAVIPTETAEGAPVPTQINGDWVINSNETYWGGTCNISGSLIVQGPYTLTLNKATIVFNPPFPGDTGIFVEAAGTLKMDATRVKSGNGNRYTWLFNQASVGDIRNSNITDVATGWQGSGITIMSTFVTLESNDIHDGDLGIYIGEQVSPKILNNTIRDNAFDGMFVVNSGATITGNTINNNNQQGDGANQGYAGATLYLRQPNMPKFENNIVTNNKIAGVDIVDINDMVIRDCVLSNPSAQDIRVDGLESQSGLKTYNTTFETVQLNQLWRSIGYPNGQKATFKPYWKVDIQVKRSSTGSAIEGAKVDIKNVTGAAIITGKTTGSSGKVLDLDVPEYELENGGQTTDSTIEKQYKPHVVWATADIDGKSLSSNTTIDIDRNGMLINVTIDDVPPELTITSPADGHYTNDSVVDVIGSTEPGTFILVKSKQTVVDAEGDFVKTINLIEGKNMIDVRATDPSGNEVVEFVNVWRDTKAPLVTITSPENGTTTNNPTPYITGSCEYGVDLWINDKVVSVQPDGTFNTTIRLHEGENTITAIARDRVYNEGEDEIVVFLDATPPTIVVVEPTDGKRTNLPEIHIKGITDKEAYLTIGGNAVTLKQNTFDYVYMLAEGENKIVLRSTDPYGNVATLVLTVYLDTQPPEVTIDFPPNNYQTNQPTVQLKGSTEPGATVKVNGAKVDNVAGVFTVDVKLTTTQNRIDIEVTDETGNSVLEEIRVTKDNIPPELRVQTPQDGEVFNAKVRGKIDVKGITEEGATVYVNGERANTAGTGFQTVLYLAEGNNSIVVMAYDQAGNVEVETLYVKYDSGVVHQILTPADGMVTSSGYVRASGFAEPGASVRINGDEVPLTPEGGFSEDIKLNNGRNTLTFIFDDEAGNSWTITRYVTKEGGNVRPSSSSQFLSILFIVIMVVLIVVMLALMMRGRKKKEEATGAAGVDGLPPPPAFDPNAGVPPPPGYDGMDPGYAPAPPPPEYYAGGEADAAAYGYGGDQYGGGYYQEGYDQSYGDQPYDQAAGYGYAEGAEGEGYQQEGEGQYEEQEEGVKDDGEQDEEGDEDEGGEDGGGDDLDDPERRKDALDDILDS